MTPATDRITLRRPLGIALSGGGALGAWQAACFDSLIKSGMVFDHVLGFSAGSLTGAGYFLGRMDELLERWYDINDNGILRFSPSLFPFTLFSGKPIWNSIGYASDEKRAKKKARCVLSVVCLRCRDNKSVYFRFEPLGKRWDAPLDAAMVASCAIPGVFPPVRIAEDLYVDGGVPGEEPLSFAALKDCADVIVIEMVRAEEVGRRPRWPWEGHEQKGREIVRAQLDAGVDSLVRMRKGPRVFRLAPSEILAFGMLSFKNKYCRPAMALGRRDADRFLCDPGSCRALSRPEESGVGLGASVLKPA